MFWLLVILWCLVIGYLSQGGVMEEPTIAQRKPYVLEIEPGTYAWCACGQSKNQPYCDGSHRVTSFRPIVIKIETKQKVAWCGGKHSQKAPFCDGTHAKLG